MKRKIRKALPIGWTCPNCGEARKVCACIRNRCIKCGDAVGNITFTLCDRCWNNESCLMCDGDGPSTYGLPDGTITYDEKLAKEKGARWGSVSCSKCHQVAIIKEGH